MLNVMSLSVRKAGETGVSLCESLPVRKMSSILHFSLPFCFFRTCYNARHFRCIRFRYSVFLLLLLHQPNDHSGYVSFKWDQICRFRGMTCKGFFFLQNLPNLEHWENLWIFCPLVSGPVGNFLAVRCRPSFWRQHSRGNWFEPQLSWMHQWLLMATE